MVDNVVAFLENTGLHLDKISSQMKSRWLKLNLKEETLSFLS